MCVYLCVCVLSTVTAGAAAVAGLLSCRVGPCVGYYLTDQLKCDMEKTGSSFDGSCFLLLWSQTLQSVLNILTRALFSSLCLIHMQTHVDALMKKIILQPSLCRCTS